MSDEQVPDHRLKGLRVWCHRVGIHRRDDRDGIADLRRIAAVPAYDANHLRADFLGVLYGTDEI